MRGSEPIVGNYPTWREEIDGILQHIRFLNQSDPYRNICLVAPTNKLVKRYAGTLEMSDMPIYGITRSTFDDLTQPGVRVGSMHRVKGLEFDHMLAACVNRSQLPPIGRFYSTRKNPVEHEEALRNSRSLLYVVCTRARKRLFISIYGNPSPLIEDLTVTG